MVEAKSLKLVWEAIFSMFNSPFFFPPPLLVFFFFLCRNGFLPSENM